MVRESAVASDQPFGQVCRCYASRAVGGAGAASAAETVATSADSASRSLNVLSDVEIVVAVIGRAGAVGLAGVGVGGGGPVEPAISVAIGIPAGVASCIAPFDSAGAAVIVAGRVDVNDINVAGGLIDGVVVSCARTLVRVGVAVELVVARIVAGLIMRVIVVAILNIRGIVPILPH